MLRCLRRLFASELSKATAKRFEAKEESAPATACVEREPTDELPRYMCGLEKDGFVLIRQEKEVGGGASRNCEWRRVHLSVRGTRVAVDYGPASRQRSLRSICGRTPPGLPPYVCRWQLDGAQLAACPDISVTYPFSFRLKFPDGERVLVRLRSSTLALAWTEALRAAINIAPDLDSRTEPVFRILRRALTA